MLSEKKEKCIQSRERNRAVRLQVGAAVVERDESG